MTSETYPRKFRCPTAAEVLDVALALLPRGRAWQSHEGGPRPGYEIGFDPGGFDPEGFSASFEKPSILYRFWKSVAELYAYLHARLCALRLEFWCATHSETRDLWLREYGLPDPCDPFPDLCTKVAAIGGTRCEYYALIAGRAGWSIDCMDKVNDCGSRAGAPSAKAGRARPGRLRGSMLRIVVGLHESPSFVGVAHARPRAGRLLSGLRLACAPDISALECILARVVHAEIEITYEAV